MNFAKETAGGAWTQSGLAAAGWLQPTWQRTSVSQTQCGCPSPTAGVFQPPCLRPRKRPGFPFSALKIRRAFCFPKAAQSPSVLGVTAEPCPAAHLREVGDLSRPRRLSVPHHFPRPSPPLRPRGGGWPRHAAPWKLLLTPGGLVCTSPPTPGGPSLTPVPSRLLPLLC